jgi:alkylation response protein AidB-like acyl-CoA dehydrogenase
MSLSVDERAELRTTARRLLEQTSSPEHVRAAMIAPDGYDESLWDRVVALGWTAIHLDEAVGGAGCGYADLAIVLHELGRALAPSPFLASAVLAAGALSLADNEGVAAGRLTALAAGESRGAVALASAGGSTAVDQLTTTWRPDGRMLRIDGVSGFVVDADLADVLVVVTRDGNGVVAVVAVDAGGPGIRIERVATVDETRRLFTVSFDDVAVADDGQLCEPGPRAQGLAERVLALGVVATACDATGATERALERTVEYAKERTQFGKPIGSFQAVKHHCADMAIIVEASRAATRAASEALDGDPAAWATNAAITTSYVGPACSRACALALLVHGGIGFTWEHDSHLVLKRVKLDEVLFGTPSWHRRQLADAVFPALMAT